MAKKAVLFDLDDTLYDGTVCYGPSNEFVVGEIVKRFSGFTPEEAADKLERIRAETFLRLASASAGNRMLYLQKLFEQRGERIDMEWITDTENKYWQVFMKNMLPKKEALQTLRLLHKKNIKTVVVTNLDLRTQMRKLMTLGLSDEIDMMVTAEEAGVAKPNPMIFYLTMAKLDMKPGELLMVGDDVRPDILGARSVGIQTVLIENSWYNYTSQDRKLPDFRIGQLSEVLNLV